MNMKRMIQFWPDNDHSGGFVVGEVRSWYNEATTLGMSDFMMIR